MKRYSKLKHVPTAKLKEILNDPYGRTACGTDYEDRIEEIRAIVWDRENTETELTIELQLRELDKAA